jgi:alpha-D-ribose 1-methylphosphonate 5-triphosphate synthase subunit PhnL
MREEARADGWADEQARHQMQSLLTRIVVTRNVYRLILRTFARPL